MQNLRLPIDVELVYCAPSSTRAGVVELVDTGDSKSPALKSVPVQVRPSVPKASNAPARCNVDADCLKSGSLPRLKAVDTLVNGLVPNVISSASLRPSPSLSCA